MRSVLKIGIGITLAVTLAACGKENESALEGKWQLKTVETDGLARKVDTVWYNFQTSLFEYQMYDPTTDTYRWNYGFNTLNADGTLELELIHYGKPLEEFLPYTDWTSPKRTFTIEHASSGKLILSDNGKTYSFEKF